MAVIQLSPGPWPTFRANTEYHLAPGGPYPPLLIPGLPDLAFRCLDGVAKIRGALDLGRDEPPAAVRAQDGAHRLLLEGLDACCDTGRGIRITQADAPVLRRCVSLGNLLEAVTLAYAKGLRVEAGCEFGATLKRGGGWPVGDGWLLQYPPDKRHGLYISHGVDGAQVMDCILRDVSGSGYQANGKDGPIRNLTGRRLQILRCGSSGTLGFSLMGVVTSTYEDLYFDGNNDQSDWLGVLFADGASGPCRNVTLRAFSPTTGRFRLENGSTATIDAGEGWSPGAPTLPPPIDPPAGMTDEEQTAAIRDLERRVTALERAA